MTISPNNLELTKQEFLHVKASKGSRQLGRGKKLSSKAHKRARRTSPGLPTGVIDDKTGRRERRRAGRDEAELPALLPAGAAGARQLLHRRQPAPLRHLRHPPSPLPGLSHRRRHRARRPVLRRAGHDLEVAADPRRRLRARCGWRGRTYKLFYDGNRLRLVSWSTPRAVYWISNTLSEDLDQHADARYRAVSEPLRRQSEPQPEEGPPRLAWGMYKRFVLAGVIITCLCAATIASAVLLEVDDGDHDLQAQHDADRSAGQAAAGRRRARQAADDPRHRRRPPQGRGAAEAPAAHALGHDDPRAPGPAPARHGADVAAARPRRRHPRPRAPEAQRRLRLRRGPPDAAHRPRPAEDPDPPLRARHLLGLPRGGRPPRLRLRRRRPQVLQRQQPAQRRRRAVRGHRRRRRLPAAVRRGRAGLRALPPPRQRPHPRRAPAVVPRRGQEPDRHRQRLLRPQGAAAHLRPVGAHRHRLAQRDPLAAAARGRVGRPSRSRRSSSRRRTPATARATSSSATRR